jgi:hypothetical protein
MEIDKQRREKQERERQLLEWIPVTPSFRGFRQAGEDISVCFLPSFEEFRRNQVHRPRLVVQVLDALNTRGWCWLRGVSACGKSTIALHAVIELGASRNALYLDLNDELDLARACEEIASRADAEQLFVLDNVHAEPREAATLLRAWQENRKGGRILFLGWPIEDEQRHLIPYKSDSLEVAPTEEDMRGVYLTLRRRLRPEEVPSESPRPETTADWLNRFGADLVAFQLAIAAALRTSGSFDWSLEPDAARRYVRKKYLTRVSQRERNDRITLALLADLGLSLPEECLRSNLKQSLQSGIVRRSEHGALGQFVRFRLWHQALGHSLVAAQSTPIDRITEFTRAAVTNPFFGYDLSRRLWDRNEKDLARTILRLIVHSPSGILGIFGGNLAHAAMKLEFLDTSKVSIFAEAASALTAPGTDSGLIEKALATQLGHLASFLGFAEKHAELKAVYKALVDGLVAETARPAADNRLLAEALATPLHFLASFLGFAEKHAELKAVYKALVDGLVAEIAKPAADNRLLAEALATPLGYVASFLGFAEKHAELKAVYKALVDALVAEIAKPAADNRLLAEALATPLHFLASFLGFAETHQELKTVYETLVDALAAEVRKPEADNRLLAEALATPLHSLASFLGFAETHQELKTVYETLVDALTAEVRKPEADNRLLAEALATPLGDLASFLGFAEKHEELKGVYEALADSLVADIRKSGVYLEVLLGSPFSYLYGLLNAVPSLGQKMLSVISEEVWRKAFASIPGQSARGFGGFAKQLKSLGFATLAEPPATTLVVAADPRHWRDPLIGLFDISQALSCAIVPDNRKAEFVAKVATPKWLTFRFYKHDIGRLAGGLFHLLAYQPPSIVVPFIVSGLKKRVGQSLLDLRQQAPAEASAILQLWAAAELAAATIFVHKVEWPAPELAEELAVKVWPHRAEIEGIGHIQQQLWMGLRLFVRHHPSPVVMPWDVINDTLRRWKITACEADRTSVQKGWDEGMIRWLEQCVASHDGRLLNDLTPLSPGAGCPRSRVVRDLGSPVHHGVDVS